MLSTHNTIMSYLQYRAYLQTVNTLVGDSSATSAPSLLTCDN